MSRAEQVRKVDAVTAGPVPLVAILLGCARGDTAAGQALRDWENGRVAQSLARTLGQPVHAQAAFDRLLDDLASGSGAFAGSTEAAAQDWLFARVRLAARKAEGGDRPAPRLYAVSARLPEADGVPPTPAPVGVTASIPPPADQRHTEPASYTDDDDSPDLASARLRRPNAAVQSPRITAVPAPGDDDAGRGRGWLGTLFLLILALLLGGGLAVLAVLWLWPERAVEVVEQPPVMVEQPSAAVAVTPSPPIPAEPAPTIVPEAKIRDRVGPPIEAPEPPVTTAPPERPAPAATATPAPTAVATPTPAPAETAAVSSPRIVVHHSDDQESGAMAEQLASQLRSAGIGQVEVRAVKFDVATASVRYFFDQDRAGAERLTAAIGPFLSWHGRAAPSTPIGFTDFRPLPRQGTIEIWLPRR